MKTEQRLNSVVDGYKAQGYQVVVRPGAEILPPFAKAFKVEILATRNGGNVLASVKKSPEELEADPNVPTYAEVTNKQPGWRFDIFILGPDSLPTAEKQRSSEPSEADVRRTLEDVQRMLREGFVAASFTAAWAALEAAMRRRLRASGADAGWGTMPRTMLNELYSAGVIPRATLRELEVLFHLRSEIVHGFAPGVIEPRAVQLLVKTTQSLLTDLPPVKQPA
jgi:hypothetical protein